MNNFAKVGDNSWLNFFGKTNAILYCLVFFIESKIFMRLITSLAEIKKVFGT